MVDKTPTMRVQVSTTGDPYASPDFETEDQWARVRIRFEGDVYELAISQGELVLRTIAEPLVIEPRASNMVRIGVRK